MEQMGYDKGLVKNTTQNGLLNRWCLSQILKRALRPRVLILQHNLFVVIAAVFGSLMLRDTVRVDVMRDRGSLARSVEKGWIENVYRLQLMNATERPQRFAVNVAGLPNAVLEGDDNATFALDAAAVRSVAVRVKKMPPMSLTPGSPDSFCDPKPVRRRGQ